MRTDGSTGVVPAPLDANAAFVIHVTGADAAEPNAVCGRAEHVASGRSLRFTSLAELADFLTGVVARVAGPRR